MAGLILVGLAVPFATPRSVAQVATPGPDDGPDIVVDAVAGIVVNGRVRRCTPLRDDPANGVDVYSGGNGSSLMTLVPGKSGGFAFVPNAEQVTGPDYWQRTGIGLHRYVFRAPADGSPMCIGARSGGGNHAAFRRIVDAAPYRGQRVRFTLWVATRAVDQVNFWAAAGNAWQQPEPSGAPDAAARPEPAKRARRLLNGGNSNFRPFAGSRGWTPVMVEIGPIAPDADHVSYGFALVGDGDVWAHRPMIEPVPATPGVTGDKLVIGREWRPPQPVTAD
ncbi:hypothetical protein ACPVPU_07685 [Sphingomonas sp. CJ99]